MKTKDTNIRMCAVVTGETIQEFIENLKKVQAEADIVELRVDYLSSIKAKDLELIKNSLVKNAIFTCRKKTNYGRGKFRGTIKEQNHILQYANDLGFDYLDIELRETEQIQIVNRTTKIILSYHDWEKTGSFEELKELLNNMRMKQKDVIKIATMAQTEYDAKNLMKLLLLKTHNEKLIVIGMGEKAAFTRVFAPLLGSYLTFTSVEGLHSAPGQLEIKTLKEMYTLLGYNI